MNSIHSLRKQGYKVRVKHVRPCYGSFRANAPYSRKTKGLYPLPKGGCTEVDVTLPEGGKTYTSKAVCSERDAFNYRVGAQIALGRIMKQIDDDVEAAIKVESSN